jgi:hypothetical protein
MTFMIVLVSKLTVFHHNFLDGTSVSSKPLHRLRDDIRGNSDQHSEVSGESTERRCERYSTIATISGVYRRGHESKRCRDSNSWLLPETGGAIRPSSEYDFNENRNDGTTNKWDRME